MPADRTSERSCRVAPSRPERARSACRPCSREPSGGSGTNAIARGGAISARCASRVGALGDARADLKAGSRDRASVARCPFAPRQARGHSDTRDCIAGGAGASWRRLLTLMLAATPYTPRIFCFAAATSASVRPFALRAASFSIFSAVSVGAASECPRDQLSVDLIITGTVSFPSMS